MIIPDVNLLLYAYDLRSPYQKKAAKWWEDLLSGEEPVGLLHVVVFGFVRIVTNPRICTSPVTPSDAAAAVRSWLQQPPIQILYPSEDHLEEVLTILEALGTAANMVTDVQIAAFTIGHKAILHTVDADFIRFPKLKWFNPITGASGN